MQLKLSDYLISSQPIIRRSFILVHSTVSTKTMLLNIGIYRKLVSGQFEGINAAILATLQEHKIVIPHEEDELSNIID